MKILNQRLLLASAAMACGLASTAQADLLVNSGFEQEINTTGSLPTDFGYWRGDLSVICEEHESGINPWQGSCMLQFKNTTRVGASSSVGSEVWQIVDVSSFQSMIEAGNATVDAGAFFNRVATGNTAVDTMFSIGVYAYEGDAGSFPTQWGRSELALAQTTISSDANLETWEQATVTLVLPEETDFVVVRLGATEDIFNNVADEEFAGHFVDASHLNIVPAPASLLCLLPAGLMGIGRRRRTA